VVVEVVVVVAAVVVGVVVVVAAVVWVTMIGDRRGCRAVVTARVLAAVAAFRVQVAVAGQVAVNVASA
jgi:hypothetical protein